MRQRKLYEALASAVLSSDTDNSDHHIKWRGTAEKLVEDRMPSGSGFDAGTKLDWDRMMTRPVLIKGCPIPLRHGWNGRLVFKTAYHHMDDSGYYDGWTEHIVTAKPHLVFGFTTTVSGSNKRDIKDYIAEVFEETLNRDLEKTS